MNAFDFRAEMIEKIRAFENWAWRDEIQNPEEWISMGFQEWFEMFENWMQND